MVAWAWSCPPGSMGAPGNSCRFLEATRARASGLIGPSFVRTGSARTRRTAREQTAHLRRRGIGAIIPERRDQIEVRKTAAA